MVITRELRNVMDMGLRDIQYDVGPLITLVDAASFTFNWEERKKLILGQVQETDQVVLSRVDRIDEKQIKHICGALQVRQKDVLPFSRESAESIDMLRDRILSMDDTP